MKKIVFYLSSFVLACTDVFPQNVLNSQIQQIATANSKDGWIYFKNTSGVDPTTIFSVYKSGFGMGTDDSMHFQKLDVDNKGYSHYIYSQFYKGIAVEGARFKVHAVNGIPYLATGKICPGLNISATPVLSPTAAINAALANINASQYMWQDSFEETRLKQLLKDSSATYYPTPSLLITMNGVDLAFVPNNFKLALELVTLSGQII